jgi:hypothetical protein
MTPEELLKPRYKVIAEYPKSPYPVGTIIRADGQSEDLLYCDSNGPRCRDFPHLFRKLGWWEERGEKGMPGYVKEDGIVYKVQEWHTDLAPKVSVFIDPKIHTQFAEHATDGPLYGDILPATQSEYESFINNQTLKTT